MRKLKKTNVGIVVNKSGDKTLKVQVSYRKAHPKYKKVSNLKRNFIVHDEHNSHVVGDNIEFIVCRPISKMKHHRVLSKNNL